MTIQYRILLSDQLDLIALAFRAPSNRIGDPAVDVGFMPAGAVDANLDLGRERSLGDLAVDGGAGQSRPDKNGFQTDDTVFSNRRVEVKHFRALSPG